MNPDNDKIYEFEGNYYQTPTSMQDDIMSFVGSLRDTIGSNTSNIARQTENLGTNIPSNLGGLGGSDSYFVQRYQTAPVESQISTLRATAQADALNKLMKNEVAQAKQRYNKAYKSYQRKSSSGSSSGTGLLGDISDGGIEYEDIQEKQTDEKTPPKAEDYYISGEEQTNRIVERTGLPDWLVNVLKIFGAA